MLHSNVNIGGLEDEILTYFWHPEKSSRESRRRNICIRQSHKQTLLALVEYFVEGAGAASTMLTNSRDIDNVAGLSSAGLVQISFIPW